VPQAEQRSWARIVDLAYRDLPRLDLSRRTPMARAPDAELPNGQTHEVFESERRHRATSVPLNWHRPSDHDADRIPMTEDRIPMTEVTMLEPCDAPRRNCPPARDACAASSCPN
jgi:hypothetical protein